MPAIDGFRPLTDVELAQLSPDELEVYEEELEGLYWTRGKDSFLEFCKMVDVPGAPMGAEEEGKYFPERVKPAAHHHLIIDAVQNMADGKWPDVDGLMVFTSPGSAKSTYLSMLAPAWLMGRKKGTNVIGASYNDDVANRFGRRVRSIVRSTEFSKIMGCGIVGDNQAVDNYSLTNASEYRAAGMNGGITSYRADWALIDDPIRGRTDADSETIREKTWEVFNSDIATRMKPGARLIIVQTRWHEDDLSGRILGEKWVGQSGLWRGTDGRLWHIINLPHIAEHADDPLGRRPGELLWPEWHRMKDAIRMQEAAKRGGTAARLWSSLYQQRPSPNEGAILARHYWKQWTKKDPPTCEEIHLFYDTAFEAEEDNDFSAMTAWGVFEHTSRKPTGEEYTHNHIILLGAWKDKINAVDLIDEVKAHCRLFQPQRVFVEKRASGIQLIQELKRQRIPVKAWLPKGKPGAKGKIPRAHAIAAILEQGSVHYYPGAKTEAVLSECAAFPYGTHDDWVDTVTMAIAWFRDKFIFMTADDELDLEEMKERLAEKAAMKKQGRRLYGGEGKSGLVIDPIEPDEVERMTEATKRRLYG
jgi:predicted phage terminase large subunit-like protein